MKKIVIVGGGAAGIMAGIAAASCIDTKVTIIEKNEKLGKKIYITGKGRCNVTNACDIETFFSNIVTNKKYMYSSAYGFTSDDLRDMLEAEGCRLKVERGNRVFPVSDHASDVTAALTRILRDLGVEIMLETEVKKVDISQDGKSVRGVFTASRRRSDFVEADAVILCTGGLSYSSTGSTGDGYRFAKEAGHEVTKCVPALVPFECEEGWCSDLSGLSLKNVKLKLAKEEQVEGKADSIKGSDNKGIEENTINGTNSDSQGLKKSKGKKKKNAKSNKPVYEEMGEMLFTHFGISGPLVLSASSYLPADRDFFADHYVIDLDLKPAVNEEQLDDRLLKSLKDNPGKSFKNAVHDWLPAKLIPIVISQAGLDPDKKTDVISRAERQAFIGSIKGLRLHITGTRTFSEAIITKGGIDVRQINASTCESKLISGLYFAGEILDIDALTGGFNLQIAWSTGHLAGQSAGQGE